MLLEKKKKRKKKKSRGIVPRNAIQVKKQGHRIWYRDIFIRDGVCICITGDVENKKNSGTRRVEKFRKKISVIVN